MVYKGFLNVENIESFCVREKDLYYGAFTYKKERNFLFFKMLKGVYYKGILGAIDRIEEDTHKVLEETLIINDTLYYKPRIEFHMVSGERIFYYYESIEELNLNLHRIKKMMNIYEKK